MVKIRTLTLLAAGGGAFFSAISLYKGDEKFYRSVAMPVVLRLLDPETAHNLSLKVVKWGFPKVKHENSVTLKSLHWGLKFCNPVGLAAGYDKDGDAVDGLLQLGFGFVEIGSVTPEPQPGNDKPRIFRLNEDNGVINRCGFNSKGHQYVLSNLQKTCHRCGIVGVSLGKNATSESADVDYAKGVEVFGPVADYLVINVSSPNTPGLQAFQEKKRLEQIIDKVLEARSKLPNTYPPILLKISPDIPDEWKKDIASLITQKRKKIDGLIVSNTSLTRPSILRSKNKEQEGGLSGAPVRDLSTNTIRDLYKLTKGQVPIIGVGGISSGQDAFEKICAGASLVQLYTALVYEGFPVVQKVKRELEEILISNGYQTVSEAVGSDHRPKKNFR